MVTIDSDLKTRAKEVGINISAFLNEMLETRLNQNRKMDVDITLARVRLKQYESEMAAAQIKVNQYQTMVSEYEANQMKNKIQEIERQKEEEAKKITCMVCQVAKPSGFKMHKTSSGGVVCNACFLAGNDPSKL